MSQYYLEYFTNIHFIIISHAFLRQLLYFFIFARFFKCSAALPECRQHFLLITSFLFILLFQLTLSTYSREGCRKEAALDLIFLFPFLSQDFSVVTSDFDVTHGWITSIIPSCQLYVLVLFSPIY